MKGGTPMTSFFKDRSVSKADWIILGIGCFLLVLVTLVYFVAMSLLGSQMEQLNAQIAMKQQEVDEARTVAARRDGLLAEIAHVRTKITRFEEQLPTNKEVPRLLNQFQQIAELSGVTYQSITAEPIDEKDLYMRIPFKVKINGTYPVIGEFLRSLEFGNRFIKVEDLDIGPQEKGMSEANFVISTYMFINKEQASESGVKQS
jgi:Tfp pilus assembly protein PilO